ncbi:MAG: hypothetical protein ACUVQ1_09490 [Candidatus Kapaibacteriales bacterium]
MERKKYILMIILTWIDIALFGQTSIAIYNAYVQGNMIEWKKVMDSFKAKTNSEKLELINYQYGYVAYCIDQKKESEAETYIKKAESLLTELEKHKYELSTVYAYKSAFIGFKIGLSPYKAPFLGQESLSYAKKSVTTDTINYFGYIQLGNIAFYTPAMFGGSKKEALKYYLKALQIMQRNSALLKNNWNYLNLLVTIINSYYEIGQYKLAEMYCKKALDIETKFDWVKNNLYPKIKKKLNYE